MRHSPYLAAAGVLLGLAAGAQPAGAADSLCDTMHAVQTSTIDVTAGDVVWTATARPGCEGATITIAAHRTSYLSWNEVEVQPLAGSVSAQLASGPVEVHLELPDLVGLGGCNWQVDAVVGGPLEQVDSSHRYNEFPIGGSRNRLVAARYVAGECVQVPPTTENEEPLPPADATPPVSAPPAPDAGDSSEQVVRFTPTPSTAPAPEVPVVPAPVPVLPQTGGNALAAVGLGGLLAGAGLVLLGACRRLC